MKQMKSVQYVGCRKLVFTSVHNSLHESAKLYITLLWWKIHRSILSETWLANTWFTVCFEERIHEGKLFFY